jgi:hypothetical protein
MLTPGAVARASMRAISADFLVWCALVIEDLRAVGACGRAPLEREGEREGEREWRFVLVFSSMVVMKAGEGV